jgi:ketosteroid isomerase-like protein
MLLRNKDAGMSGAVADMTCGAVTASEEEIRNVVRSWEKAIQAGDVDRILANHSDDVLMFDVPEPLQSKGLRDYKKTWELFFRYSSPGNGVFIIEDLKITSANSVGFATGLLRIGGSKNPVCRLTLGLKKVEGNWLIVHEHHSAPHTLSE